MNTETIAPIIAVAMLILVGILGYFEVDLAAICVGVVGGFAWALPDVTGLRGMPGNAGGAEQFITMMRFVIYCAVAALVFQGGIWLSA